MKITLKYHGGRYIMMSSATGEMSFNTMAKALESIKTIRLMFYVEGIL